MSLFERAAKSRHESANEPVIVAALLRSPGVACVTGAASNTASVAIRSMLRKRIGSIGIGSPRRCNPAYEFAELAVELFRRLPERHVPDVVVPGGDGGLADVERVLRHRGQDDRVVATVTDEHRHGQGREDVVTVQLARD